MDKKLQTNLDANSYNTILDVFCKECKLEKEFNLMKNMKTNCHSSNMVSCNIILCELVKLGRIFQARKVSKAIMAIMY